MQSKLGHITFHLLRKLMQAHTARWQNAVSELTKPQYSVLFAIAENVGIEQSELMDLTVSTKATLAEILARLEKRGLIVRKQGESDRRRRFVYLTDEGGELFFQAKANATQVDNDFLSSLSQDEQQEFIRMMKLMINSNTLK